MHLHRCSLALVGASFGACVSLALATPSPVRAQQSAPAADGVASPTRSARGSRLAPSPEARVDSLMARFGPETPGAAIGVLAGGKLVFAKGYGRASLEYPVPITSKTIFHVASVSKQFTAFAIVLLAQDGRLRIDDDVRRYIPELPNFGPTMTLRHLLNHTSGLRDQWDLWALSGGRMDDVIRTDDLFRLATRQQALNFPPGQEYLYCNTGYMLLAKVVERVSGQSFATFLQARVFAPLGMRDTRVHDDHEQIVPGRAYSYNDAPGGGYRNAVLSYANAGATSLFTTVEDLSRWLENFQTGALGGSAARETLLTRGIRNSGDTLPYALGIAVDRWRGQRRISHGGSDAGFRSYVAFYPDLDAGVIVLSNLGSVNATAIATAVTDAFLGHRFTPAPRPPASTVASVAVPTIDPARLDALTGTFEGANGFTIAISRESSLLYAQAAGQPRAVMRATTDSTFVIDAVPAAIRFVRHASRSDSLRLEQNGAVALLTRRAAYVPTAADLTDLVGRYYSPELDAVYDLLSDGTSLRVQRAHYADVTLSPKSRDFFTGAWPLAMVFFERDATTQRVRFMRVTSGRVRDLRFARLDPSSTAGASTQERPR